MRFLIICIICYALGLTTSFANTYYDIKDDNLNHLFQAGKAKYVIRYEHQFEDTLFIPQNSELLFDGGCLSGPIVFNNTKLSGKVNLKGANIKGKIRNKTFDASWLCYKDGISDDAQNINDIIEVCGKVFFPRGKYCLISEYKTNGKVPKTLESEIRTHIGINKSNVSLIGENGTVFYSNVPLCTISVFSQPNQIENSIGNIRFQNIAFEVENDGNHFYEFMHSIRLIGVNGLLIKGCTFKDFWGDAISLSHYGDTPNTGERTRNQNVKILNNIIIGGDHHNNRNGISIASGRNLIIKDNIIKNTSRKDMPGGIDIEPNNSAYTIENIRIENNTLEGIGGSNGAIGVVVFKDAPAHKISIIGNRILNSNLGLFFYVMSKYTSDNFTICENYTDEQTTPYHFMGGGHSVNWYISNNTFERPCLQTVPGDIKIDGLVIKNYKKKD